jgi:hypothetical protein
VLICLWFHKQDSFCVKQGLERARSTDEPCRMFLVRTNCRITL